MTKLQEAVDENEAVTIEWLSAQFGPHLASCPWKRYTVHFATDKLARAVGWCPPCGDLPACICINEFVVIRNPTRRQLNCLLEALCLSS
jgi:hypothetical protein